MHLSSFALWLALCLAAVASSGRYPVSDYGYGSIVSDPEKALTWEALSAHASRAPSIERLLALIAKQYPELFENFTLMRESHSLQEASPSHPRAIVFQRGGKLIFAFNGDPALKGFDRIEVMIFREPQGASSVTGAHYEFRELRYRPGQSVTISAADPDTCRRCHGTPLRPIWAPYSVWPGAYGKFNDGIPDYDAARPAFGSRVPEEFDSPTGDARRARNVAEERAQLQGYLAFRKIQSKHPRYRFLKLHAGSSRAPYGEDRHPSDEFRPNLQLTHLLSTLHARTVAGDLAAHPCWPEYGPRVMAALLDCGGTGKVLPTDILQRLGYDRVTWHPGERPESWNYYVGIADFSSVVADQLYPEMRREDPGLPAFAPMDDWFYPSEDRYTPSEGGRERLADTCRALNERVQETPISDETAARCLDASRRARGGHVIGMCLSCHDGSEKEAPVLPLADRKALQASPQWVAAIRDRITRADNRAMPPGRALSRFEREELLEYLRE